MFETLCDPQIMEIRQTSLKSLECERAFHQCWGEGFMHGRVCRSKAHHHEKERQFRVVDWTNHLRAIDEVSYSD